MTAEDLATWCIAIVIGGIAILLVTVARRSMRVRRIARRAERRSRELDARPVLRITRVPAERTIDGARAKRP